MVHSSAYIFVGLALVGGILAVTLRNILHAIFGLALALFAIAALFVYLDAPFLAAMQVLIYIGGISVAMVFAVMTAHALGWSSARRSRRLLALPPAVALTAAIGWVLHRSRLLPRPGGDAPEEAVLKGVGRALLTHYNVVFEALSVVLLLAIVGAILIARKEDGSG